jgi:hypothetical protein
MTGFAAGGSARKTGRVVYGKDRTRNDRLAQPSSCAARRACEVMRVIQSLQTELHDDAPVAPNAVRIELRVAELRQLFNAMDPSPFGERDLDPKAEAFIFDWAREAPRRAPLTLLDHLDRDPGLPGESEALADAVHRFFAHGAASARRRLRELLRRGRISLLIGLTALAVATVLADLFGNALSGRRIGEVLRESLAIGGWVAMWRPLEVFLYDWWPIRAEARLFDRLAAMPVRIAYQGGKRPDAWRSDWPAVSPASPASASS